MFVPILWHFEIETVQTRLLSGGPDGLERTADLSSRPIKLSVVRANCAQVKSNSKPRLSLRSPPRPGLTHCNSPIAQFPASVGGMVSLATLTGSWNCTDVKIDWC